LIPSKEVLNAYEPIAYLVEDRIEGKNRQAQTLATLRDTLLPRLISGQLRLPEAEVMREAVAG
jgi:type I restriction enzyme S subunit